MPTKAQTYYIIQHVLTTFALAYLITLQSGAKARDAFIAALVMSLRDLRSLFDHTTAAKELNEGEIQNGHSSNLQG